MNFLYSICQFIPNAIMTERVTSLTVISKKLPGAIPKPAKTANTDSKSIQRHFLLRLNSFTASLVFLGKN